jgi:hypothetical protein
LLLKQKKSRVTVSIVLRTAIQDSGRGKVRSFNALAPRHLPAVDFWPAFDATRGSGTAIFQSSLISWPEEHGHDDIVRFLTTNLNEEKAANTRLNTVAMRKGVNRRALS